MAIGLLQEQVREVKEASNDPLWVSRRRETRYSPTLDGMRRYLTDAMSPSDLAAILKNVDNGDIAAAVELSEEMEAKDAHLQGIANTRRQAITALAWDVMPDPKAADPEFAVEVADFCREQLTQLVTWPNTLKHLSTAIGPGIAVTELIWHKARLVKTFDVPGHRLIADPATSPEIFLETEQHLGQSTGIPLKPGKFVVFTPESRAGFPLRVTLSRAGALLYVIKHYSVADWTAFSEVFGTPYRHAKWKKGALEAERTQVQDMLENAAADHYLMTSDNIDIELIESGKGTHPGEQLVQWCNNQQAILWLGQTLTSDTQGVGSFALGNIHDGIRGTIARSDLNNEARVIRQGVLSPMTRFRFPGRRAPVPMWVREIAESRDLDSDRVTMEKLRLLDEKGLPVDPLVVYEKLGIPVPKDFDAESMAQEPESGEETNE